MVGRCAVSDYPVRLESVARSYVATRSTGLDDVGTVPVKPELVGSSQTDVNVEWGRNVVRAESDDLVGVSVADRAFLRDDETETGYVYNTD